MCSDGIKHCLGLMIVCMCTHSAMQDQVDVSFLLQEMDKQAQCAIMVQRAFRAFLANKYKGQGVEYQPPEEGENFSRVKIPRAKSAPRVAAQSRCVSSSEHSRLKRVCTYSGRVFLDNAESRACRVVEAVLPPRICANADTL